MSNLIVLILGSSLKIKVHFTQLVLKQIEFIALKGTVSRMNKDLDKPKVTGYLRNQQGQVNSIQCICLNFQSDKNNLVLQSELHNILAQMHHCFDPTRNFLCSNIGKKDLQNSDMWQYLLSLLNGLPVVLKSFLPLIVILESTGWQEHRILP